MDTAIIKDWASPEVQLCEPGRTDEVARLKEENAALQSKLKKTDRQLSSLQKMLVRNDAVSATRDRLASVLNVERSKQEKYLNMMLENSSNIILLLDKDGHFSYCTNTFLRAAGIQNFGLIDGRHFSEVFTRFNSLGFLHHVEKNVVDAIERHATIRSEETFDMGGEGGPRVYATHTTAMRNESGEVEGIMILCHDVTETLRAKEAAEAANRAKSEFLASMSHEIRTPLNAVNGLAELELRKDLPSETLSNLEKIYGSGITLLNIINDILDISKIESGRFELIPIDYEVASIISDTVSMNIVRIGSKPITFRLEIDENLPNRLYGDELRTKQILNNLLSNAIKYTPNGVVELGLSCEREGGEAWLNCYVKDSGIGITNDDMRKLFSEYQQVDMSSHRTVEGTGLGLSICKRLVELMGGTIKAESEYGKGSTFSFRIRQTITDTRPIGKESADNLRAFHFLEGQGRRVKSVEYVPMPYGSVLVVDDVRTNLDVAKGMLSAYDGLTIHCVTSGRQAIEMVRDEETTYDAIFMDHMMPELDGVETVRIIREEIGSGYARTVPIIALTANAILGNDKMFLENGFQAFLTKPIDVTKLDAVMRKFVRDKQSEETRQKAEAGLASGDKKNDMSAALSSILDTARIEGLDISSGLRRFNNSVEVYMRVISSFIKNTPAHLDRLRSVTEDTLPEYAVEVHGVKGSCYGISADAAGKAAEGLEIAAKTGNFEMVSIGNATLIAMVEALISDLKDLRKSAEKTEPPDGRNNQSAPDKDLLLKLLAASRDYDIDIMQTTLDELDRYSYASNGDLIPWLKDRLLNFGYDDIREKLEEYCRL
ncbi:MAG: response regulator [Synergistaceae bacterium]|jgi:PAS domain S-box-containing protein|nr:response regulator [Synergistaceae bacterium]